MAGFFMRGRMPGMTAASDFRVLLVATSTFVLAMAVSVFGAAVKAKRFSLRSLLILVTLAAMWLGLVAAAIRSR